MTLNRDTSCGGRLASRSMSYSWSTLDGNYWPTYWRDMANDLTPSEMRFVHALCRSSGPMGIAPLGLSRALGVTTTTIINLAATVERKGFCTRERYGMRIFLRPTSVALALVSHAAPDGEAGTSESSTKPGPTKSRAPRVPRRR